MKTYAVGIIGVGKIAAMYGKPDEAAPYCHVGGIRQSSRVRLAAVADMSEAARQAFRERWGAAFPDVRYHDSADAMLRAEPLDIVAICVRGPHHFATVLDVLKSGVRSIFLEKPPSCSLEEMDAMRAAAAARGVPVTVSYSRHWAPHVLRMQALIREGLVGEVRSVTSYAGNAFLSFASHATDAICQLAGYQAKAVYARGHVPAGAQAPEGFEAEPYLDAMVVEFANGVTGLQVGAEGAHGGLYAEVAGTAGYARIGMYIPPYARNKDGDIDLDRHGMPPPASVFKAAYEQIAAHLDGGPLPDCTDDTFAAVNEIGFAGIESALTGRRIELPNAHRSRRVFANG